MKQLIERLDDKPEQLYAAIQERAKGRNKFKLLK
jgi:hypothetical protein